MVPPPPKGGPVANLEIAGEMTEMSLANLFKSQSVFEKNCFFPTTQDYRSDGG